MIKAIIADDHAVVRTGLQLIFDETNDLIIRDEASNGDELIEKIREKDYDVVILDLLMPGKDTIDTLQEIKSYRPQLPVVVFTMNPEESFCVRLFKNGADAYIPKESNPKLLIQAIRTVIKGRKFYTPGQIEILSSYIENSLNNPLQKEYITDREFQVLSLIASGMKKDDIASKLKVSKHTISNHRNNILKKLSLHNNSELTRYAIKQGIISY